MADINAASLRLGAASCQLASATSVLRSRAEDKERVEQNGGSAADYAARIDAAVTDVEKAAERLLRTID